MTRRHQGNLRRVLTRPAFYSRPSFEMAPIVAETVLQIARVPHAYGFAFNAVGSAPHLLDFEGVEGFDGLMRADGFDPEDASMAMRRCLFELLERIWCFDAPADERITRGSRDSLGDTALDPRRFSLLAQFEYERLDGAYIEYTDGLALDWMECPALIAADGAETRLVPVPLVYQGYGHRHPDQRFVPVLSTGLAAGTRYDAALLRGLCEAIERDAFMVRWLGRLPPPVVPDARSRFAGAGAELAAALAEDGFSLSLHDLTADIPVPVLLLAIRNEGRDEPAATVLGLGCDPSPGVALDKALREALTMMSNWFDFADGTTVERNAAVPRATPAQSAALDAFLAGELASPARIDYLGDRGDATMPAKFLALLETLRAAGHSVFYGDLTPADAGEHGDFVLIRALIPGLQPMLYERECWRLGNPRLLERLNRLSGGSAPGSVEALNLELNPFTIEAAP